MAVILSAEVSNEVKPMLIAKHYVSWVSDNARVVRLLNGLYFILCEPTESAKGTDQKHITSLYISRLTDCLLK